MSAVTGHFPPSQHDGPVVGPYPDSPVSGPYYDASIPGSYPNAPVSGPYYDSPVSSPYYDASATGSYPDGPVTGQYHHRHAIDTSARRRRGMPVWAIAGIVVVAVVIFVGVGAAVAIAIRSPSAPADTLPVAPKGAAPATVRLGDSLVYRAGKTAATYSLVPGQALTLTPSGSRPSRGQFLGLKASVKVTSGSVYLTDDNFILVTTDGRRFEPDVSFLFDGGLRGARATAGQTATGLVVWDIPTGSEAGATVELQIEDGGLQGTWQLP